MKCAVLGCKNCSGSQTKTADGITFHKFPTEVEIRNAWITVINKPDWTPTKYSKICSTHFEQTGFYTTRQGYRKLRHGVLPKLLLNIQNTSVAKSYETSNTINSNSIASTSQNQIPVSQTEEELKPFLKLRDTPRKKFLKREIHRMKIEILKKNKKIKRLQTNNRRLKKKIVSVQKVIEDLKEKNLITSSDADILSNINVKAKELLKRQINKSLGKPVARKYSADLRTFALTLNFYSPKAYEYVRRTFDSCLPAQRTIAKWYQTLNGEPGFTEESFKVLKQKVDKSEHPVICNLVLDEMAIKKHVEFDGTKYYGFVNTGSNLDNDTQNKATQALVFMLVGVNGAWKLPVGFFFIDGITGEQRASLVTKCLINAYDVGVKVVGLTMDGCPSNLSMTKILGCSFDLVKTSFKHPSSEELVHVFLDACHMIKLIRNAFEFTKTFYDYQGNVIEWKYLVQLNELQKKETLNLGNKLTDRHINFHREKMKVKLASQLFSTSVAKAIESCQERHTSFKGARATIFFITLINDLFDVLNSKNVKQYGRKKALCEANFAQTESFLIFAKNYLLHLSNSSQKMVESRRKTGFLGMIFCIDSAISLYNGLVREKRDLVYLPLYKFSQDHLELFFGNIRAHGRTNNNPTARQFQSAYKKTLVNTELKDSFRGNCIPLEHIGILSCSSRLSAIDLINSTSERSRILEEQSDTGHDSLDDALLECSRLLESEYSDTHQIVTYIAGYLVRRLQQNMKCEQCIIALHSSVINTEHRLIALKSRGKLVFPSSDVIKICLRTECIIRKLKKESLNAPKFNPLHIVHSTVKSLIGDDLFALLNNHMHDQHPLFNHVPLLIKAISQKYCKIRLKYYSKLENIVISKRQHLNKVVLFSGQ